MWTVTLLYLYFIDNFQPYFLVFMEHGPFPRLFEELL
jgi:hypothetical protein